MSASGTYVQHVPGCFKSEVLWCWPPAGMQLRVKPSKVVMLLFVFEVGMVEVAMTILLLYHALSLQLPTYTE